MGPLAEPTEKPFLLLCSSSGLHQESLTCDHCKEDLKGIPTIIFGAAIEEDIQS